MGTRLHSPTVNTVHAKSLDRGRRVIKSILTTHDKDLEGDRVNPTGGVWRDRPFVNWEHGVLIGAGSVEIVSRKGMLYPLGTSDLFQSATDIKGVDLTRYDDQFRPVGRWNPDTVLEAADDARRLIEADIATGVSIEFLPIRANPNGGLVSATGHHKPTDFHEWEGLGWAHTVRPINPGAHTIIIDKAIRIAETGRLPGGKPLCSVIRKSFDRFKAIPRPALVRVEKAMDELDDADLAVAPEGSDLDGDGTDDADETAMGDAPMKATPAAFAAVVQMYKDASKMLRDMIAGPSMEHVEGIERLTQEADAIDDMAAALLADGRTLFKGGGLEAPDDTAADDAEMPVDDDGELMAKGFKKGFLPRFKASELKPVGPPDADPTRVVQLKATLARQEREIRRIRRQLQPAR